MPSEVAERRWQSDVVGAEADPRVDAISSGTRLPRAGLRNGRALREHIRSRACGGAGRSWPDMVWTSMSMGECREVAGPRCKGARTGLRPARSRRDAPASLVRSGGNERSVKRRQVRSPSVAQRLVRIGRSRSPLIPRPHPRRPDAGGVFSRPSRLTGTGTGVPARIGSPRQSAAPGVSGSTARPTSSKVRSTVRVGPPGATYRRRDPRVRVIAGAESPARRGRTPPRRAWPPRRALSDCLSASSAAGRGYSSSRLNSSRSMPYLRLPRTPMMPAIPK